MKPITHRFVLIFITVTIVATIALQIRWNVKNYSENKQRVLNEIQIAFDNGVENYYTRQIKKEMVVILSDSVNVLKYKQIQHLDSTAFQKREKKIDTIRILRRKEKWPDAKDFPKLALDEHKKFAIRKIQDFNETFMASFYQDSINFEKLDSLFLVELERKNLNLVYDFHFKKWSGRKMSYGDRLKIPNMLMIKSNSPYLMRGYELTLRYSDPVSLALHRSMIEIILSLVLSLSIIGSLLYLLHIINRQKKIDEIRNDLISNITHEFKTPITTIGSAIEGIRNFTAANDTEKTNRYLDISERQLDKLQTMVEKLLDTATLDTDSLILKKESVNLADMLHSIAEKFELGGESRISFKNGHGEFIVPADAFHLETAISNLVDNAVKYGGNEINLRLEKTASEIGIFIEDNGIGIDKGHRDQIFEKFYRVPTGNIHDVKGFGIGLFYSRKIIEKHDGSLTLLGDEQKTVFKITLPYA